MSRILQIENFLLQQPNDDFLQHALALEYIKIDDDANAAQIFLALLQRNPNYVGSYYHLAKLYERIGDEPNAITTYQKGMEIAKAQNENHAYGELRGAYEELTF
jgi:Tfp pilus assembly protein PilF